MATPRGFFAYRYVARGTKASIRYPTWVKEKHGRDKSGSNITCPKQASDP